MRLLHNLKVGSKIVLLIGLFLFCMGLIAGVGIFELQKADKQSNLIYNNNMLALSAAKEANIHFINTSRALRNMALGTPQLRDVYRHAHGTFTSKMWEELRIAEEKLLAPEAKKLMRQTKEALDALQHETREIMDNMDKRTTEQTFARLLEFRQRENEADNQMSVLGQSLEKAAEDRNLEISANARQALVLSTVVLALATLLGLVLGCMIRRAIASPLADISGKARLVATGDLAQQFFMDRRDELGSLSASLDTMVVHLRTRIAEAEEQSQSAEKHSQKADQAMLEANVARERAEAGQTALLEAAKNAEMVAGKLSEETEKLSVQIEQSHRSADLQRERVASSATAMEEMAAATSEVASNAGIVAESSNLAREKAEDGQQIVLRSIEAITSVQKDTEELRHNMVDLNHQAESIGTVITVISDIADQTNLLALNAAIEAARAGNAGRGFAVVADEVRKLAEKTMFATKEVETAISGVQSRTRQSSDAVKRTTENLAATSTLVKQSGEALDHIVLEVSNTATQINSIATAAEQQSSVSEEISRSLEEINEITKETTIAMSLSAQAISELALQANELQHLVNELRKE